MAAASIKRRLETFDLIRRFGSISRFSGKISFGSESNRGTQTEETVKGFLTGKEYHQVNSDADSPSTSTPVTLSSPVDSSSMSLPPADGSDNGILRTNNSTSNHAPDVVTDHIYHFPRPVSIFPLTSRKPLEAKLLELKTGKTAAATNQNEILLDTFKAPHNDNHHEHNDAWEHHQIHHEDHSHGMDHQHDRSEISTHISALYGMLIVVVSFCLGTASQLTKNIDTMYARWFDSALLAISIVWILFAFCYLFRSKKQISQDTDQLTDHKKLKHLRFIRNDVDSGSFYLKMGATLFAVGSMIYSCLQLGVFIENISCFNIVMGVNPCLFILFILLQLYFIFKNSQLKITKYRAISRFGLIHLLATDLCMWMRTLLDETIMEFGDIEKSENKSALEANEEPPKPTIHFRQGAFGYNPICVNEESSMLNMLNQSAMFLFPCIIEYTLISAGIVFIMWQVVGSSENLHLRQYLTRKNPKIFSVDCTHAANGLFAGILVIILTIIGLIMYFMFEKDEDEKKAVLAGDIMDIALNILGVISVAYCGIVFRKNLKVINIHTANMALDDGLLLLTMIGVYAFTVVSVLGSLEGFDTDNLLDIVQAILEIVQSTMQTAFLFDASKRVMVFPPPSPEDENRRKSPDKPGREMVMFLLTNNFAQWALNVLLTLRPDAAPGPKHFYGSYQWAVLLHITVPLVIFYRFHSTVCLFDIWKRSYKVPRGRHDHEHPVQPPTNQPRRFSYFAITHSNHPQA
ncbi:proton channel OtopLc-like [Paramacrobiotus metropolitanus]|uniref:proton channel OtopLc-like n=1 Tax=Paramacrobiotus metropolitanus TaxID=2943436 RepID=UPI002445C671|nr:proton channel OtopLc-like [Paramacrobiotus metropolitanus]